MSTDGREEKGCALMILAVGLSVALLIVAAAFADWLMAGAR
jgi:hypothetical protein